MIFNALLTEAAKRDPLDKVTWGEITHVIEDVQSKLPCVGVQGPKSLTDRETEFIQLLCNDKTTVEISNAMGISPRTVEAIRGSLKKKIGAKSTAGIAIYAVQHGLLNLNQIL